MTQICCWHMTYFNIRYNLSAICTQRGFLMPCLAPLMSSSMVREVRVPLPPKHFMTFSFLCFSHSTVNFASCFTWLIFLARFQFFSVKKPQVFMKLSFGPILWSSASRKDITHTVFHRRDDVLPVICQDSASVNVTCCKPGSCLGFRSARSLFVREQQKRNNMGFIDLSILPENPEFSRASNIVVRCTKLPFIYPESRACNSWKVVLGFLLLHFFKSNKILLDSFPFIMISYLIFYKVLKACNIFHIYSLICYFSQVRYLIFRKYFVALEYLPLFFTKNTIIGHNRK